MKTANTVDLLKNSLNRVLITLMGLGSAHGALTQDMIIDGKLTLHSMDEVGASQHILVRLPDSSLARAVTSISEVPISEAISLASGLANYQVGYNDARIYKYEERVYLQGVIRKLTGNFAPDDIICILPEAYRPRQRIVAHGRQNANSVRLTIFPDGRIQIQSVTQPLDFLSIDNIHFYRNETLKFGDFHEGGYIFYIAPFPTDLNGDGVVDQGLVAATVDLSSTPWGCASSEITGFQNVGLGSGAQNTLDIINDCVENSAAKMCEELISNGYHDWFLPSRDELIQLNNAIGFNSTANMGNIQGDGYWSSSEDEFNTDAAFGHDMSETGIAFYSYDKSVMNRVRAIRAY